MARKSPPKDAKDEAARKWALPTHQKRSRAKRDRLLKAGEKVFAVQGFADAHVSEIARRAGCSIGSFYRRFKDKEALFLALQEDMHDRAHADIERFFAHSACRTAPLTRICYRLIQNAATASVANKGYYRALFEISLRGSDVWPRMRALERYHAEKLRDLLEMHGNTRLRRDFMDGVTNAIRMVFGAQMSLMLNGPGPYEHGQHAGIAELTRVLMNAAGIEPDERELKRIGLARSRRSASRR